MARLKLEHFLCTVVWAQYAKPLVLVQIKRCETASQKWETKPDPCRDKISWSSGKRRGRHSGRRRGDKAKSMSGQDLTEHWETQWQAKWETKPDPCRDNISQSSGRRSGRQSGRQNLIHVLTRSYRAVGVPILQYHFDKIHIKM